MNGSGGSISRPRTAARDTRDAEIVTLYRDGATTYEIAAIVNLSRARCCQILHENGIVARKWRNRDVTPKPWTTDRRQQRAHNISNLAGVTHNPALASEA